MRRCDSAIIKLICEPPFGGWMKNRRLEIHALVLLLAAFFFAMVAPTFAQSDSSSLSGDVTDSSGALVPDAKITARNTATLAERSISSNESGGFTLTNLAP